jgi:hypothetical protein
MAEKDHYKFGTQKMDVRESTWRKMVTQRRADKERIRALEARDREIREARLVWAMTCDCRCPGCQGFDEVVNGTSQETACKHEHVTGTGGRQWCDDCGGALPPETKVECAKCEGSGESGVTHADGTQYSTKTPPCPACGGTGCVASPGNDEPAPEPTDAEGVQASPSAAKPTDARSVARKVYNDPRGGPEYDAP